MWPPSTRSASFSSCRMEIRPTNWPSASAHRCVAGTDVSVLRFESDSFLATNAAKSCSTPSRSPPNHQGRPSCRNSPSARRKLSRQLSVGETRWIFIRGSTLDDKVVRPLPCAPHAAKIAQARAGARAYTEHVPSTDDRRQLRFWRPDTPQVTAMLRVEHEDRTKTTYSEHFTVVVVYEGAFDGWYRGGVRAHVAGSRKLKEPGE